ncbi:MAG: ABC transporter substrate-binding protein [Beutenbergiaceae bacterium]
MASSKGTLRPIAALVGTSALMLAACSSGGGDTGSEDQDSGGGDEVTLEFMQWWEPELPSGSFRELMDRFESENPGITVELISGPWSQTREQIIAGTASNTIADVVGLDGSWLYDLNQQGAIADLSEIFAENDYDNSQLVQEVQIDGSTYMVPAVNFAYPLFVNLDLLAEAGVAEPPTNRSEFLAAASAVAENTDAAGWALPLSLESANGVQNDILPWVWAGGGQVMDASGQPDLENADSASGLEFVRELWDAGVVSAGAFSMAEQDKVEEFAAGRVAMMFSSLAHINMLRESDPNLNFTVVAPPVPDGYSGDIGINTNSWGIGISAASENKEAAFKLVEFILSAEVNSELSTWANGFPGNVGSAPDFNEADPLFEDAFNIFSAGYPMNEFVGAPVAQELQRLYATETQRMLDGDASVSDTLATIQSSWLDEY